MTSDRYAAPAGSSKSSDKTASITITPVDRRETQARITELMRQIRLAEAYGGPVRELRKQLDEAVDSLKQ